MERAFYRRTFLNPEERGGIALIEAAVHEVDSSGPSVDADITIGDCNRHISLDFTLYDKDGCERVRQKAKRLRSTVNGFVTAVLAACDEIESL